MNVTAQLAINPIGTDTDIAKFIVECQKNLKNKKLTIQLHAEGTNIEGELDTVLDGIKDCIEAIHKMGVGYLVSTISISSRTKGSRTMKEMVNNIEKSMA